MAASSSPLPRYLEIRKSTSAPHTALPARRKPPPASGTAPVLESQGEYKRRG
jgi:hypothetical protein